MQISLMSGWILISASAFNLLQYIALVGVYKKKSDPTLIHRWNNERAFQIIKDSL